MKTTTITGVFTERRSVPYPTGESTALCLKHQDLDIPGQPVKEALNAYQAYAAKLRCAVCGEYLGLPDDQISQNLQRRAEPEEGLGARVAVLTDFEMRLLVILLHRLAGYTGQNPIDLAVLVPQLDQRRELISAACQLRGKIEVFYAAEAEKSQYETWTYEEALAYFARRIAPDLARSIV